MAKYTNEQTTWRCRHGTERKPSPQKMKKTFRTSFIVSTKVSDSNSYQQELINRKNKSTSLKYEMQNVPLSDRNNIPYIKWMQQDCPKPLQS